MVSLWNGSVICRPLPVPLPGVGTAEEGALQRQDSLVGRVWAFDGKDSGLEAWFSWL